MIVGKLLLTVLQVLFASTAGGFRFFDMLLMRPLDDHAPVRGLYRSELIQHDLFDHVVQLLHRIHRFAVTFARMPHAVMTLIAEPGFLLDRAVLPFP